MLTARDTVVRGGGGRKRDCAVLVDGTSAARVAGGHVIVVALTALALMTGGCAPGEPSARPTATPTTTSSTGPPSTAPPTTAPTPSPSAPPTTTAAPRTTTAAPTSRPTEDKPVSPSVQPVVLRPGDSGPRVRAMQARLRQIGWFHGDVTDYYGSRTTEAVRGFQGKRGLPVTGVADQRTYDWLLSMTRAPTSDELNNTYPTPPGPAVLSWDLDQRCLTGRVICISKSTRSLTWVVDGTAQYSMDVRFGSEAQPTREGVFAITWKKIDVVSTIYHTPMPYSMFFSGGQAIHYSADFALNGYDGSSHGCVNVRNLSLLKQLYATAPVGTKVVVHW